MSAQDTANIILGSGSAIRAHIIESAGIPFMAHTSHVDEDLIKTQYIKANKSIPDLVEKLAFAKAQAVFDTLKCANTDYIIGADQVLAFEGRVYDKPKDMDDAYMRLRALRGAEHQLIGAVCLVHKGSMIWSHISTTKLVMRDFSDDFLQNYLDQEGESILACVGAYKFEGRGAQLFERVEGDFFSILGLSLLPLLTELRRLAVIET